MGSTIRVLAELGNHGHLVDLGDHSLDSSSQGRLAHRLGVESLDTRRIATSRTDPPGASVLAFRLSTSHSAACSGEQSSSGHGLVDD
jgi:hypothetical protein